MALAKWNRTVQDEQGNVVDGAQIEVVNEDTLKLAILFSDRNGTQQMSNPFTTGADGGANFHVTGGVYKVTARKGAFSFTWRWEAVGTAQQYDFEQLYVALGVGIFPYMTLAELQAFTPTTSPVGGVVWADPDTSKNGYYIWNGSAWNFARSLPDSITQMSVVGGDANNLQVVPQAGVDMSRVLLFFIDVATPNTGAVKISINGGTPLPALDVNGEEYLPSQFKGRMLFSVEPTGYKAVFDNGALAAAALQADRAFSEAERAKAEANRSDAAANDAADSAQASEASNIQSGQSAAASAASATASANSATASNNSANDAADSAQASETSNIQSGQSAAASAQSAVDAQNAVNSIGTAVQDSAASATAAAASAAASDASANSSADSAQDAETSNIQSGQSAAAAAGSASAASTSAGQSAGSATASANSATASANSATASNNSANDAADSAQASETSNIQSGQSAAAAAGSASAASTSAGQSAGSATASATSAGQSADSATASAGSADLAQKWANNPAGVPVANGEFSAYHWAMQAMGAALGDMVKSVYDPTGVNEDAFLRSNHHGKMPITGLDVDASPNMFVLGRKDGNALQFLPLAWSKDVGDSVALRHSNGELSVADATGVNNAVPLGQLNTMLLNYDKTNVTTVGAAIAAPTPAGAIQDGDKIAGVAAGGATLTTWAWSTVKAWIKGWLTKADVGLGNVSNTAPADLPVSTATANALAEKFDKTGGTVSGNITVTGTTISVNNDTTSHFWARNAAGTEKFVLWCDTVGSNANLRVNNVHTFSFQSNGTFSAPQNIAAFSDARLKSDVETICNALEIILKLRGTSYIKGGSKQLGFIAQEVREVIPEAVFENREDDDQFLAKGESVGTLSVAADNTILAVAVEAIKQLSEEIERLKEKLG